MNFIAPDKINTFVRLYHKNNKVLLPLTFTSYLLHKNSPYKYINSFFITGTTISFAYHSYISTSSIITDYIKPKNFSNLARVVNLKSHALSTLGFIYFLYNHNKNFL